jgi:hypothetical protein
MAAGWSITRPRIFDELSGAKSVLLAGCGGGYDVLSSIPLYFALRDQGKAVTLSNLSFSSLVALEVPTVSDYCHVIDTSTFPSQDVKENTYFPELYLAQWLKDKEEGRDVTIYAFQRSTGVAPMIKAYQMIIDKHEIDAVVLVDGGMDSLMFGDEESMGTPAEDHCSMAALSATTPPTKLLVCIGFGVDSFHGVSHGLFLENVASVERSGGFYGSFSVSRLSREGGLYIEAYKFVSSKMQPSIVCTSIIDGMEGRFGDYHSTKRTGSSKLFINALMSQYWVFKLATVMEHIHYTKQLLATNSINEVARVIGQYNFDSHKNGKIRKSIPLPM